MTPHGETPKGIIRWMIDAILAKWEKFLLANCSLMSGIYFGKPLM